MLTKITNCIHHPLGGVICGILAGLSFFVASFYPDYKWYIITLGWIPTIIGLMLWVYRFYLIYAKLKEHK